MNKKTEKNSFRVSTYTLIHEDETNYGRMTQLEQQQKN